MKLDNIFPSLHTAAEVSSHDDSMASMEMLNGLMKFAGKITAWQSLNKTSLLGPNGHNRIHPGRLKCWYESRKDSHNNTYQDGEYHIACGNKDWKVKRIGKYQRENKYKGKPY